MKKWILILVAVAVAGGWAFMHWRPWNPMNPASGALANRSKTSVVESRNIQFAVTAAGDIGPAEQVSVRPEINGRIKTLPVDIGDRVKKGQVLFTLDDKDLQTERESRLTEIARARLELERAERNFQRSKQLFADKLISLELFEDTKTEFELGKNSLERAEKELHLLEDRLTKTQIEAPFDCTVLTRPVSVGQAVSGSGGFNSGTEILTIADLNDMIISAHINQADVTRLSTGQEVEVQVESVPGLRLRGTVDRVAPQTTMKNNIKGYAARISLKNIDPRVLPGMTANLSIPIASAENALAIPLAAVFTEQGERFVYIQRDGEPERRAVEIGIYDYDYAEVLKGLSAGEEVWLEQPPGQTAAQMVQDAGARALGMNGNRPAGGIDVRGAGARGTNDSTRPGGGAGGQRPATPRSNRSS